MSESLPKDPQVWMEWSWQEFEPYAQELRARSLTENTLPGWLADWSALEETVQEMFNRLSVAITVNTVDAEAGQRYNSFLDEILPRYKQADQDLKKKLLASGLQPAGFEVPLRNLHAEVDLFREANLPLLSEEKKLGTEYDKIIGAQTVEWEGKEVTLPQLSSVFQDVERSRREQAWRLTAERQLADRQAINDLWQRSFDLRRKLAANAGKADYRAYRWQELLRFDYSPADSLSFQQAIEAVVVPVAQRIYEKRRQQLGVEKLRPWDLEVDPLGRPALSPFQETSTLVEKCALIFQRVDPQLGEYFNIMIREHLLDLENRKNKAPGGYCTDFPRARRPFIFMNAVGLHDDVQTLLHEGGHAFHVFESASLPYAKQLAVTAEFAEVASMSMELLASPYLAEKVGGFYSEADTARARVEHLEGSLLFWPYMAVVDAFQHWAYENPELGYLPAECDAKWVELWERFMPSVDWSGLEEVLATRWQRKLHIHRYPFYYIEYGLALLGAAQIWKNSLVDYAAAVAAYRQALALGYTVPLPELYAAAGARLAFDRETIGEAVLLMETTATKLEGE